MFLKSLIKFLKFIRKDIIIIQSFKYVSVRPHQLDVVVPLKSQLAGEHHVFKNA